MKTILVLGGTREALHIANYCHVLGLIQTDKKLCNVIYSIAGVARTPKVDFEIRVGGFGGWQGLSQYLSEHLVSLIIDVTHPYAANIKSNTLLASHEANIPLYRYVRPSWQKIPPDVWMPVTTLLDIFQHLSDYKRPFFTVGRSALELLALKKQPLYVNQHWLIRHIQSRHYQAPYAANNVEYLEGIGPFFVDTEIEILNKYNIDVLISKNSGGDAVCSKILAARQLGIPVLMLNRPEIVEITTQFDQIADLETELRAYIKN